MLLPFYFVRGKNVEKEGRGACVFFKFDLSCCSLNFVNVLLTLKSNIFFLSDFRVRIFDCLMS